MTYSRTFSKDGIPYYFKNGKRTKKSSIPRDELIKFDLNEPLEVTDVDLGTTEGQPLTIDQPEVETVKVKPDIPFQECIFCGKYGTKIRALSAQVIYLCDDHYYSSTLGQIAKKLNERSASEQILAASGSQG